MIVDCYHGQKPKNNTNGDQKTKNINTHGEQPKRDTVKWTEHIWMLYHLMHC